MKNTKTFGSLSTCCMIIYSTLLPKKNSHNKLINGWHAHEKSTELTALQTQHHNKLIMGHPIKFIVRYAMNATIERGH
jgi:hypothetical protein